MTSYPNYLPHLEDWTLGSPRLNGSVDTDSVQPHLNSHPPFLFTGPEPDAGLIDPSEFDDELDNSTISAKVPQPGVEIQYELRLGPRLNGRLPPCTWLDQDRTATYDPDSKFDPAIRPPPEIAICKKRDRADEHNDGDGPRANVPKIVTWQRGRYEGKRHVLTFSFASETALARMWSYGASLDQWPKSVPLKLGQDNHWQSWWHQDLSLPESSSADTRRKNRQQQEDREDESDGLEDLTLGHPAARGCIPCFKLKQRCPLLDEGSKYPCDTCTEDDVDCELIRAPARKRTCENCARRRIPCSYGQEGSDHAQPCENCKNKGFKCIAGPASGRTRSGPSLDCPNAKPDTPAKSKQAVSCIPCRKARKWCSLKGKTKGAKVPACNRCKEEEIACTSEPLIRPMARDKLSAQDSKTDVASRAQKKSNDETFVITTNYAHPIAFNCGQDQRCDWCEDAMYGMIGLGEVQVEVKESSDGQGFIEVAGGHTAAGLTPSRMCCWCTLDRMMIAACQTRHIEPTEGMDLDGFDYESVQDWMLGGHSSSAPFPWCSICPNAAFFKCCSKGDDSVGSTEEGVEGCGLLLCEACAVTLVNEKGGHLGSLIGALRTEDGGDVRIRADVDFLLRDGELLQRYHKAL